VSVRVHQSSRSRPTLEWENAPLLYPPVRPRSRLTPGWRFAVMVVVFLLGFVLGLMI